MDYHGMKRKDLQALCKKHNLRANGTNLEMADRLASLLRKPEPEPKKVLKSTDGSGENGSKVVKKVTFSSEQDQIQFFHDADNNARQTRNASRRESVVKIDVPKTTRSRRGKEDAGLVSSPVETKRPRRGEKGSERVTNLDLPVDKIDVSTEVEETGGRMTRSTRRVSLGGGVDVKIVKNDSPVKTRREKVTQEKESKVESVEEGVKVKQTRSRRKIEDNDAPMPQKEESRISEERDAKTRRGRANRKGETGSAPIVVEKGVRQTRSRRNVAEDDAKEVSSLPNDAQMAKEESENAAKLEERDSKRSKKSKGVEKPEVVVKTWKRRGARGSATDLVEGESVNASKPEPAPRRTRRTAPVEEVLPTQSTSVVEEPPVTTSKRKSIAPTNVVAERPSKRRRQTTTHGVEVDNLEPGEGNTKVKEQLQGDVVKANERPKRRATSASNAADSGMAAAGGDVPPTVEVKKLRGKTIKADERPKRRVTSAPRSEPNAVDSGVTVSGGDAPLDKEEKEKALRTKVVTMPVKSKTGAKKSTTKGKRGRGAHKEDDNQDVEVSAQGVIGGSDEPVSSCLEEVIANVNAHVDESIAITEDTNVYSAGEARVEINSNSQDNSVSLIEKNVETEGANVALSTGDHAISEELVEVYSTNTGVSEQVMKQVDEYGQTDSSKDSDHPAQDDIPLCYSNVKDGKQSSAKSIIRSNKYKMTAEAKEKQLVDAYDLSAKASSEERIIQSVGAFQDEKVEGKTPLYSEGMGSDVKFSRQEDGMTAPKKLDLTEGLAKSNPRSGKSSSKLRPGTPMEEGSERKTDLRKGFEVSRQQSPGLRFKTVSPGDVNESLVSGGLLAAAEKGNSPLDHSLSKSAKLETNDMSKNDEDMDTVSQNSAEKMAFNVSTGFYSPFVKDEFRNSSDDQTDSVDTDYSTKAVKGFSDSSMSTKSAKAVEAKEMAVGALEYSAEASSKGKSVQSVRGNQEHVEEIQSSTQIEGLEETIDCQDGTQVEDESLLTSQAFSSPEVKDRENIGAIEHISDFENSLHLFEEKDEEMPQSSKRLLELKKSHLLEMHSHSDAETDQSIPEAYQGLEGRTENSNRLSGEFVTENNENVSLQSQSSSPSDAKDKEFFPGLSNIEEAKIVLELGIGSVDKEDTDSESVRTRRASTSTEIERKENLGAFEHTSDFENSLDISEDKLEMHGFSDVESDQRLEEDATSGQLEAENNKIVSLYSHNMFQSPPSSGGLFEPKESNPRGMHAHLDVELDQHPEGDTPCSNQLFGGFVAENDGNVSPHSDSMFQSPQSSDGHHELTESDPLEMHGQSDVGLEDTTHSSQVSGEFVAENNDKVSLHSHTSSQSNVTGKEFFSSSSNIQEAEKVADFESEGGVGPVEEDREVSHQICEESVELEKIRVQGRCDSFAVESEKNMSDEQNLCEENPELDCEDYGELSTLKAQKVGNERKTRHDDFYHNSETPSKIGRYEGDEPKENASILVEECGKENVKETTTLMFQNSQGSPLARTPTQSVKETEVDVATVGHDRDYNNSHLFKEHNTESLQKVFERINKLKKSCFQDMPGHTFEFEQHFLKEDGCLERKSDPIGCTSVAANEISSGASLFSQTSSPINLEDTEVTSSPSSMEDKEKVAELEEPEVPQHSAGISELLFALGQEREEQPMTAIENSDEKLGEKEEANPVTSVYTVGISQESLQETAKQEYISMYQGEEEGGCSLSVSDYPIPEYYEGGEDNASGDDNTESDCEHVIEAFPETFIDSSLRCIVFHRESVIRSQGEEVSKNNTVATEHTPCEVGLFSGDNTEKEKAALTPNKSYEQSFKGKELSDYVPAVQVEDTGMKLENIDDTGNVGASTPHLTLLEVGMSSGDDMEKEEAASAYNRSYEESLKGKEPSDSVPEVHDEDIENKLEDLGDTENINASTLHIDEGIGLQNKLASFEEGCAPDSHNVNMEDEQEDIGSTLRMLFPAEDTKVPETMSESSVLNDVGKEYTDEGIGLHEEEDMDSSKRMLFADAEASVHLSPLDLTIKNGAGTYQIDAAELDAIVHGTPLDLRAKNGAGIEQINAAELNADVRGTPLDLTIKNGAGTHQLDAADLDANVHGTPSYLTVKSSAGTDQTDAADLEANVHEATPLSTIKKDAGKDHVDDLAGLFKRAYVTTAVKKKDWKLLSTPAKTSGQHQQHPGLLASGMKENATNSKLEQSAKRRVEKSAIKRRALGELQNSTAR